MSSNPFHWGVRRLKIDPVLLVSGKFRILELEAILPDGLIVEHGHLDDTSALEIELEEFAEDIRTTPIDPPRPSGKSRDLFQGRPGTLRLH